jgi:hypothetical protein
MARITTLSTSSQRFGYQAGFGDNQTSGSIVDGVFAVYQDNVNSGNWVLRARSNSVDTDDNSSSAVAADTWYKIVIIVYADNRAELFINGTSVATVTSGLPTGAGRGTGFLSSLFKSVGTTSRTVDIDYIEVIGCKKES